MSLVSYDGWNNGNGNDDDEGEGWQHSPKKSADPRGIFPGLFRHDEYEFNLHSLVESGTLLLLRCVGSYWRS